MKKTLRTWNPWQELDQLTHQFDQLFTRQWPAASKQNQLKFGAVNVLKNDQGVLVQLAVPGLEADDLDISLTHNSVTVKANRDADSDSSSNVSRQERSTRQFSRSISLPVEVDPSSCDATYTKGVLTLKLEQPEEQQPKKIEVKAI
ncbi:Spore protein SP21 [Polystyrenella longa]|uniref:Spore protein SP21 n=1 Tax=Polystyrenella longa TaxID=2528007 RepID=A0A518CUC6_9PLAN|nr:Hsp20/alpha crystallin family protein [Polystyrenella longa]QDU82840.1 Spore protein SP21 [Polystyrenella longa]